MSKIIKYATINSLATFLYIVLVVSLLNLARVFVPEENTFLIPITMLLLFVFSAALTGFLVFGKPVLWYLEGKKNEGFKLLFGTLTILFSILLIMFFVLAVII